MKQLIIGTAGHIDHGKTSLIRALSGFEGDTLDEEKRRGITIDLSFSHLSDNGNNISFIDVPGHEKLVKTMICGAFGFDGALLVVDAKEGLMPQSIEHLHVLELLCLKYIVVAISKADLVSKEDIENITQNVKEFFKNNFSHLVIFDILSVSIYDENSLKNLKNTLFKIPKISRVDRDVFRYYIDRTFSLKGIGTIVTGTVLEGFMKKNSKVCIANLNKEVNVKNLQVHNENVEIATQGQRVAVNLSDVSHSDLERGYLLTKKGYIRGFYSADIFVKVLPNRTISHDTHITFHVGAKEVEAKILYYNEVKGFAKVEFEEIMYLVFNEPFIITKAGVVCGGGVVLNAINDPLKKQLKQKLLEVLHENNFLFAFRILIDCHKKGFGLISSYQRFGLTHEEAKEIAFKIPDILIDEKAMNIYPKSATDEVCILIKKIYEKNPYALLSANSLSIKHTWISQTLANSSLNSLEKDGLIAKNAGVYQSTGIKMQDIQNLVENKILEIIKSGKNAPEAPYNIYDEMDLDRKMGDDALKKLTQSKKVIRLSHNLFICTQELSQMIILMKEIITKKGFIDINEAKDKFSLSRKYLVAYLDYLDKFDDIKKIGDKRVFA